MDPYTWRATGVWWFSHPTGAFNGRGNSGTFDLDRDFHFGDYSTFTAAIDWRFKRKHHLLFAASPVQSSRTATLTRTISFQGQTYDVGARVTADIKSLSFSPGYQYDIIRRDHGYVALVVQIYLLDTKAMLSGAAALNGQVRAQTASGSVFAPLPVLGPRVRWYPLHNSSRLVLDGFAQGLYFFGYGDFVSARGTVGVGLNSHWKVTAGYQLGTRLSIHGKADQIGVRLTQQGPVAGIEASW